VDLRELEVHLDERRVDRHGRLERLCRRVFVPRMDSLLVSSPRFAERRVAVHATFA
jgi:hypothetical protein